MTPEGPEYLIVDAAGQPLEPALLPFDSLCLGRGLFETMLVINGNLVFADRHEARLAASCAELSIASANEVRAFMGAAADFAAAAEHPRARLRIAAFAAAPSAAPAAIIALAPCASPPDAVSLAVSDVVRNAGDPLAAHKTVDYLANALVRQRALDEGSYDGIVIDGDGNVAETATANIFLDLGGGLVTPALGAILPGIMRAWVLETAPRLGVAVDECKVPAEALSTCNCAFITNSLIGLVGVSHIAGRPLRSAAANPSFSRLFEAWHEALDSLAG